MQRILRIFLVLVLVLAAGSGMAAWRLLRPVVRGPAALEVRVPAGAGARQVARQLREAGLDVPEPEFLAFAILDRTARHLRAGRYKLPAGEDLRGVLGRLRRGEVQLEQITFKEGATLREMRALLDASADLRHDTKGWDEAHLLAALGEDRHHAEGLFAPDTYLFDPGTSDLELLRRALAEQRARLARAWEGRAPNLPYEDPYEALTMASIIEKETGAPAERPMVAAVFVNRRRLGMPLQTDPAVIYGLGEHYEGRLHKRDLLTDTPYNTYTRAGLPPTPISAPGVAALEAALHPQDARVLYFVARGDGTSEFSADLAAHNRAVDRYQRGARATAPNRGGDG